MVKILPNIAMSKLTKIVFHLFLNQQDEVIYKVTVIKSHPYHIVHESFSKKCIYNSTWPA